MTVSEIGGATNQLSAKGSRVYEVLKQTECVRPNVRTLV